MSEQQAATDQHGPRDLSAMSQVVTEGREPTVLDWFKSLLRFQPIPIPDEEHPITAPPTPAAAPRPALARARPSLNLRALAWPRADQLRWPVALLLAFIAQSLLEARTQSLPLALGLYAVAAALAGWACWRGEAEVPRETEAEASFSLGVRARPLAFAGLFALLTLLTAGGNRFRLSTLLAWSASLYFTLAALWEGPFEVRALWRRARRWLERPRLQVRVEGWTWLVLAGLVVAAYYRFARLDLVPYEMWSDHAEKLLDVVDVLNGTYRIYFPRNTGREAFQFYLAAATARLLGTGISFMTLKIGTALAGFLTLPFVYLFAKEIGGRLTGLLAMVLAGFAYWPNLISRMGLRFPLYPLFAAPALYFLLRGFRTRQRKDFLYAGIAAGIGLHGYSPARAIPVALATAFVVYALHRWRREPLRALIPPFAAVVLASFVLFLPLFRVMLDMPDYFMMRTLTRVGTLERPYPGPPLQIFLNNVWRGLLMFGWDNGELWILSIPGRPALDWVTAGLFHLGVVMTVVRYVRWRDWRDAYLLLSIPILMLPSTLALAFPNENPAPNRASAAMVPVFTLAALPLAALFDWSRRHWPGRRARLATMGAALLLLWGAAAMNGRLVFQDFARQHRESTWNTSDAGRVVRGFAESIGTFDTAHVIPYPHWMDTRLVGIVAGKPTRDYALWREDLDAVAGETRPQLFLLKPEDEASLARLRELFAEGRLFRYDSPIEGKDFLMYFVPGEQGSAWPEGTP